MDEDCGRSECKKLPGMEYENIPDRGEVLSLPGGLAMGGKPEVILEKTRTYIYERENVSRFVLKISST